jgi:REP element-mobilizing transposase RayT
MSCTKSKDSNKKENRKRKFSYRLPGHDYCHPGAYFVTICTYQMHNLFGDIIHGGMRLNSYGEIVQNEWFFTPIVRDYVQVFNDEFVVMPNHIHGVIWIVSERVACLDTSINPCGPKSGSLGAIIGQFKSTVTKQINHLRNTPGKPVWQRNFFDHIIRNENELDAIRKYIQTNPFNWDSNKKLPIKKVDLP